MLIIKIIVVSGDGTLRISETVPAGVGGRRTNETLVHVGESWGTRLGSLATMLTLQEITRHEPETN